MVGGVTSGATMPVKQDPEHEMVNPEFDPAKPPSDNAKHSENADRISNKPEEPLLKPGEKPINY